jgi:peptidoglycan/LPS O-acetylase OafA/YrhL
VIIAHINAHFGVPILSALFAAGILGVYIFFVISGFLITTLLLKEKLKTRTISLKKFYSRRTLRIFPLAYLYILLVLGLNFALGLKIPGMDFFLATFYLANLAQFFNVHYLFHHFWSLAVEEQFYLLIAPLLKLPLKVVKWVVLILLPVSLLTRGLLVMMPGNFFAKLLFDLTRCIDGLLVGSLFAFLAFNNMIPWKFFKRHAGIISFVCLLLVVVLKTEVTVSYFKPFFNHTFYSFIIGVLLVVNIQENDSWIYRMLNTKVLVMTGLLSYSLYMWQQLFTDNLLMAFFPWNLIGLPVMAWLSYHYFEMPFLKLKAKYSVV